MTGAKGTELADLKSFVKAFSLIKDEFKKMTYEDKEKE
jgi:hypothetical protein